MWDSLRHRSLRRHATEMTLAFKHFKSFCGLTLVILYLLGSAIIILQVSGCHEGGFLRCDFDLIFVLAPAVLLLLGFEKLGINPGRANLAYPGPHLVDVAWLALYLAVSSISLYLLGLALGWICTLILRGVRSLRRS
jgi:hypothetical protein